MKNTNNGPSNHLIRFPWVPKNRNNRVNPVARSLLILGVLFTLVVIQPAPGKSGPGHIALYDGQQWVSDYRQKNFWGQGQQPPAELCEFYRP